MHHLCAMEELVDTTVNSDLDAVPDQILNRANDHFVSAKRLQLVAAWVGSATLIRSRLVTPSLRQVTPPMLYPFNVGVLPTDLPNVADFRDDPFELVPTEELAVEVTANPGTTEQCSALLWLRESFRAAPKGQIYTIRGTSVTAAAARTWTELTVTWDDTPAAGQYAVIGGVIVSTNAIAFRTIFENQTFRPGGLGMASDGLSPWFGQVRGGLGEWGRFTAERMPNIEVYNNSTDSSHVIYLDIVRVS